MSDPHDILCPTPASPGRKPGVDSAAVTCGPRGNRVPRLTPGAHAPGSWAASPVQGVRAVDRLTRDLLHCPLTDHLNTVRDIARYDSETQSTTVVNHLVYDAYGNVTAETNAAVESLFLFTARPFDPDTGLQNNLNRWYDPAVGRWLSEDPIRYWGAINLSEYVGNRPVQLRDPSGLACTVKFKCSLTSSALSADKCKRDCHYTCREVSRVLSAGGTITCEDLPSTKIAGRKKDTQNVSWLCILTGGRCGVPRDCALSINDAVVYYDPIVNWGDCSRAQCRGDCDKALAVAKQAAELIPNKAAREAAIKAAEVAAVGCRDACDAYCKKP